MATVIKDGMYEGGLVDIHWNEAPRNLDAASWVEGIGVVRAFLPDGRVRVELLTYYLFEQALDPKTKNLMDGTTKLLTREYSMFEELVFETDALTPIIMHVNDYPPELGDCNG